MSFGKNRQSEVSLSQNTSPRKDSMNNEEKIKYLPYEQAAQLVAAIQEEEDIERPDHRILTVYNHNDKEICWYDFEEVMKDAGASGKQDAKDIVSEYILHHIPDWALDL